MPICHQNKFIFFHIPRCGGTSVEAFFGLASHEQMHGLVEYDDQAVTLQHLTAYDMLQAGLIDVNLFESCFKFVIIRDPFERMASDYLWQKHHDPFKQFAEMSFDDYLQFAEHVMQEHLYFERRHYDHFRPMNEYCLHDQQLIVDDILLLENIDEEFARLQPILGRVYLPQRNATSPHYDYLRTPSNIDKVEKVYAEDKAFYDRVKLAKNQSKSLSEVFGRLIDPKLMQPQHDSLAQL